MRRCILFFLDFEYDGLTLSDMGYIVCTFNSSGLETVTNGTAITFNTVPTLNGAKHEFVSTKYDNCMEPTLQICKNPNIFDDMEISIDEFRYLSKWLNRKEFHKFRWTNEDNIDLYCEASFNISKLEIGKRIYGLELSVVTNRPFPIQKKRTIIIENDIVNSVHHIYDTSDEEGFIYPHMSITLKQDGDLEIWNTMDDRTMKIQGCSNGEIITVDYPCISSSIQSHKLENDFNWNFLRIINTFRNKRNDITISLPCTIELSYFPVVKAGI